MEAKEKAKELYYKMLDWVYNGNKYIERNIVSTAAKRCALIAVDELISHSRNIAMVYDLSFDESTNYWNKVKQEIEKL